MRNADFGISDLSAVALAKVDCPELACAEPVEEVEGAYGKDGNLELASRGRGSVAGSLSPVAGGW